MNSFDLIPDLNIGHIVEVTGTTIRVELSGDVTELTRTHDGRVYPIGQIGSIVKVHFGRRLVFGFVTLLRMRSEELLEVAKPIPPDADQRVMEVELFAEGVWNALTAFLKALWEAIKELASMVYGWICVSTLCCKSYATRCSGLKGSNILQVVF